MSAKFQNVNGQQYTIVKVYASSGQFCDAQMRRYNIVKRFV